MNGLSCNCCSTQIKNNSFKPIFDKNEKSVNIQQLIFDGIGKLIVEQPRVEQVICDPCITKLNEIKIFKQRCFSERSPSTSSVKNIEDEEMDIEYLEYFSSETEDSDSNSDTFYSVEYLEMNDESIKYENLSPLEYLEQIELASIEKVRGKENFANPIICCGNVSLENHINLLKHVSDFHKDVEVENQLHYSCIIDDQCSRWSSLQGLSDHILNYHSSVSSSHSRFLYNCSTCNNSYGNKIEFSKHMCVSSVINYTTNLTCPKCNQTFISQKRFHFHRQFHVENPRPKICLVCLNKFNDEKDFYNHVMFSHETNPIYECEKCEKIFSSLASLLNHQKLHKTERKYSCNICNKLFLDKQNLNEHSITHMNKKPFKCYICNKTLNRLSRLRKHILSHEKPMPNNVIVCNLCDLACATEEKMAEHWRREHEDEDGDDVVFDQYTTYLIDRVYCCEYCERAYRNKDSLMKHRKIHKGNSTQYLCEYCQHQYDSYGKLKTHKTCHESQIILQPKFTVQRQYLCHEQDCLKSYMHWSDLYNHMKTHFPNPISCNICNQIFYYRWSLNYHKKICHSAKGKSDKKSTKCSKYNLQFVRQSSLIKHQEKDHGSSIKCKKCNKKVFLKNLLEHKCKAPDGPVVCPICSKKYLNCSSLKVHDKVVHQKIINYYCDICSKGFFSLNDKKLHRRTHTKEKPYKCKTCSYECRTKPMLVAHVRVHTNERPYKCPFPKCTLSFKRSYAMKIHFKIHTGEKEFHCTYDKCNASFRAQFQLNTHIRRKHLIEILEDEDPIINDDPDERQEEESSKIETTTIENYQILEYDDDHLIEYIDDICEIIRVAKP